jgi:mediator of RNA polymerase II transcription subunit 25
MREIDVEIHKLTQDHATAVAQNRMEDAIQIKKERDTKVTTSERLKQMVAAAVIRNQQQQQQLQNTRNSSLGQPQPTNLSAQSNTQPPSIPPQVPGTNGGINLQDVPRGPDPKALIQLMQNRTGTNQNSLPASASFAIPANATPEGFSQMQKLMESRGIRPPQPSSFVGQPTQQNQPSPVTTLTTPLQQSNARTKSTWDGSLTWTGFDPATNDRKELHAEVKVACSTGDMYVRVLKPSRFFGLYLNHKVWLQHGRLT